LHRFRSGEASFPIKDLPLNVIHELSFAVAARLAVGQEPLDEQMQAEIATACWQAITK
jgi:hypothetical protein